MDLQTPIALALVALAGATLAWRQLRGLLPTKKVQPAGPAGCSGCSKSGSCSKLGC